MKTARAVCPLKQQPTTHISGKCHTENDIKSWDAVGCREHAYRITYKKRIKRLVAFDSQQNMEFREIPSFGFGFAVLLFIVTSFSLAYSLYEYSKIYMISFLNHSAFRCLLIVYKKIIFCSTT
uniref:Uncharacterized protein n=1 Tax=Lynx canadensis TaxID=61383 RepID=A0A667GQC0_LYNCA